MMRRTCRNIANMLIADGDQYRLRDQNRIYTLADRIYGQVGGFTW